MKDSDRSDIENKAEDTEKSRRDFIKKAGKVSVTVPAVALLLSASEKAGAPPMGPYDPIN